MSILVRVTMFLVHTKLRQDQDRYYHKRLKSSNQMGYEANKVVYL